MAGRNGPGSMPTSVGTAWFAIADDLPEFINWKFISLQVSERNGSRPREGEEIVLRM
jgi:hypothetical protein